MSAAAFFEPDCPFDAKGIGEVCICPVPSAISNAIHNATGGTAERLRVLPMTPERVLGACLAAGLD